MGRKNYKALIVLLLCLAACVKDKPPAVINTVPGATGNVYIVCEGVYPNGNATLYAWNPVQDSVYGDIFRAVNNQPLGDVFESMQRIGDKLFLAINNSDKVVVLNASNWVLAATLSIPQPRYILPISPTKAFVSSLYHNKVYIINPQTMQVTDSITMPGLSAEGMYLYYNTIYTGSWDLSSGNKIYGINTLTDKVSDSVKVAGNAPQELLLDKDQMLWVLAGDEPQFTGTMTRLDPSTGNILQSYTFPAAAYVMKPVMNITKDSIYFIEVNYNGGITNNGIYRMGINDDELPQVPFLQAAPNQYFYALGIEPSSGNIFVGDPKGFSQNGAVYIYRPDGTLIKNFNVGKGPGHFYFDE